MSDLSPILIAGEPSIGDLVRTHTLVRLLAAKFPGRAIDILTTFRAIEVVQFMPIVRHGFAVSRTPGQLDLGEKLAMGRRLRREGYGSAYVVMLNLKSALIPFFARIPERIGYFGEWRWPLINRPRFGDRKQRRMLDTVSSLAFAPGQRGPLPEPQLHVSPARAALARRQAGVAEGEKVVILVPGWDEDFRSLPLATNLEIARHCLGRGGHVWLIGSGALEQQRALQMCQALPQLKNFTSSSFAETVERLAAADLVVSKDGGPFHTAAALGRPTIGLFGLTEVWWWGAINPQVRYISATEQGPPVLGGFYDFRREHPKAHQEKIPLAAIIDEIEKVLGGRGPAPHPT